ncbi:helix-turn-helix domain-containing protein [Flavitalea flava]
MSIRIAGIVQFRPIELKAIDQSITYVQDHFMKDFTSTDLAEIFSLPIRKLQQGIKKKTGMGLHDYLIKVRMENAKLLLSDFDLSVKEIANKIGYKTPSHFGDYFKKTQGLTPSQYRSKLVNPKNLL